MKVTLLLLAIAITLSSCRSADESAPRVNHVMLYVSDPDVSRTFYEEAFGLELFKEITEMVVLSEESENDTLSVNITLMRFPGQKMNVELIPSAIAADTTLRSPHFQHLGFEVSDITASMQQAKNAGAELARPMRELQAGDIRAKNVFYFGPDGELIELMEILEGRF